MSSKFSLLASAMPTFTKKTTVEAKVDALTDYQVQLLEYLRYTLSNLDADNFNPSGLEQILEPVVAEIKDTEGNILDLWMTAEELAAQIEDADGNYTKLQATVNGLSARITTVDGRYTTLSATVDGIQTTVSDQTTAINGHTTSISNLQSQITQTADKISAVVSAVDDDTGKVTAASIVAAINAAGSSVKIAADHVNISGFVTISDLEGYGSVEINAGNIAAGGTLSGVTIESYGDWDVTISDGRIIFGNTYEDYWDRLDGGTKIQQYDEGVLGFVSTNGFLFETGDTTWILDESGLRQA